MKVNIKILLVLSIVFVAEVTLAAVRIKDLSRISNATDNSLVGYGVVTGLAGTGDSHRSAATNQSIINILQRFGLKLTERQMRSRNVAAVMIVASLPPYAQPGDKLDVNVTSLGDARSLLGGTLVRTDLRGVDGNIYALAQGPLSIGGFQYDHNGNLIQKNHPTAGTIPSGAIIQRSIDAPLISDSGIVDYVLYDADLTTASRMADAINKKYGSQIAKAINAAKIRVRVPKNEQESGVRFLSDLEILEIEPDSRAKVVVNERTGTVVSGGDIQISPISMTHGDLMLSVSTEYQVSQPIMVARTASNVQTAVVPKTEIYVDEETPISLTLKEKVSISQLVASLNKINATPRDIIVILQAIKRAGALHAQLILQ